jgi:hypothetical protein
MSASRNTRNAAEWLSRQSGGAQGLMRQAQALTRLQQDIDTWSCSNRLKLQVGPFREAILKLYTDHAATLARARQQLPSLQQHLRTRGWQIDQIDLKLKTFQQPAKPPQREKQGRFSENARAEWLKLKDSLHDERIKAATEQLCRHNGWDA